jgi:hypothetical protein
MWKMLGTQMKKRRPFPAKTFLVVIGVTLLLVWLSDESTGVLGGAGMLLLGLIGTVLLLVFCLLLYKNKSKITSRVTGASWSKTLRWVGIALAAVLILWIFLPSDDEEVDLREKVTYSFGKDCKEVGKQDSSIILNPGDVILVVTKWCLGKSTPGIRDDGWFINFADGSKPGSCIQLQPEHRRNAIRMCPGDSIVFPSRKTADPEYVLVAALGETVTLDVVLTP